MFAGVPIRADKALSFVRGSDAIGRENTGGGERLRDKTPRVLSIVSLVPRTGRDKSDKVRACLERK
jgi:hypothetical protein